MEAYSPTPQAFPSEGFLRVSMTAADTSRLPHVSNPTADSSMASGAVSPEECQRVVGALPWLEAFRRETLADLAPLLQAHDYAPGATLFYEDDESDAAYFMVTGAVEIFKSNQSGKKMPLVVLRDKGVLGEIGLLTGSRRTATARALNAVRVLELPRAGFEAALLDDHPAALRLSLAFAKVLAQRLAVTDEKLFELFQNDMSDLLLKQLGELQSRLVMRWTG